jgi:hypothetical protein
MVALGGGGALGGVRLGFTGAALMAAGAGADVDRRPIIADALPNHSWPSELADDEVEAKAVAATAIAHSSKSDRVGLFRSLIVLASNERQKETTMEGDCIRI